MNMNCRRKLFQAIKTEDITKVLAALVICFCSFDSFNGSKMASSPNQRRKTPYLDSQRRFMGIYGFGISQKHNLSEQRRKLVEKLSFLGQNKTQLIRTKQRVPYLRSRATTPLITLLLFLEREKIEEIRTGGGINNKFDRRNSRTEKGFMSKGGDNKRETKG